MKLKEIVAFRCLISDDNMLISKLTYSNKFMNFDFNKSKVPSTKK